MFGRDVGMQESINKCLEEHSPMFWCTDKKKFIVVEMYGNEIQQSYLKQIIQ